MFLDFRSQPDLLLEREHEREAMKKALSLATLIFFALGLAACNHSNDITGINSPASETGPEALATVTSLADDQHKVAVMAPNQPNPLPHIKAGTPTPSPTPICILRPPPKS
jgi:hypothetical protein